MEPFDSIICVSQTPWQGTIFQNSAVQLMTELSGRYRILYVDYQFTIKDWMLGAMGKRPVPLLETLNLKDPLYKKTLPNGGEVHLWTPPLMLPINFLTDRSHDRLIPVNSGRLVRGVRKAMHRLDMKRPLVINAFNPIVGLSVLGKLDEYATIYYCFDEITAEAWISRHGYRYEQEYLRRVDAVVTTSEALKESKSRVQPQTYCVKNGANFELFHTARQIAEANPPDRSVVGYLGTADNRIDIDLIEFAARTMPEVEFQFIGGVIEPQITARLAAYKNVVFIPPHRPADLPPLLAKMKAAIIPFVRNEHTLTIYPLKINEYLAAGLGVVSTNFSKLDEFADVIERADTPEAFAQAIRKALDDRSPERIARRIDMARNNSWERRAEEFEAVIRQLPGALTKRAPA